MKNVILISLFFAIPVLGIFISLPSSWNINNIATAQDLDMTDLKDSRDKKKRFFDFMRPIIDDENAKVSALRKELIDAKNNNNNKAFVAKTAESYKVSWEEGSEDWDTLLKRVNTIAPELALAQSANESAWGQSRFAQQGNNFFGQWCYKEGCGIVPEKRKKGSRHEVAKFDSVNDSVRSYIKNINTGDAYQPLRNVRNKNKVAGKKPSAYAQAGGLIKYSERREEYVKEIRAMIKANEKLMQENQNL